MITSLRLQNFRSYKDESFEFEPKVNIVVGPNAAGKTNLLEAVFVLARGGSFKNKDIDLVMYAKDWSRLDSAFDSTVRTVKLEKDGEKLNKTISIDGKNYQRLPISQKTPLILFEPNYLNLFTKGPQTRRDYFDSYLEDTAEGYKPALAKYQRTLAQRNRLLKSRRFSESQMFAWNIKLSELAGIIVGERLKLIERINKKLTKTYSAVANKKSSARLEYKSDIKTDEYTSSLLSGLEKDINKDTVRGFTGLGPHREDFIAVLNKQAVAASASRGETRTLLLALKIFELNELEELSGQKPILLLDDVFSELDGARRRYLVDYLKGHQTIITTTDADAVTGYFLKNSHKIIPLG